jgi:hypothetical protein
MMGCHSSLSHLRYHPSVASPRENLRPIILVEAALQSASMSSEALLRSESMSQACIHKYNLCEDKSINASTDGNDSDLSGVGLTCSDCCRQALGFHLGLRKAAATLLSLNLRLATTQTFQVGMIPCRY